MPGMEKPFFDFLWCIRSRFRMCAYARFSCGSICFTKVKDAWRAPSDSQFGVSKLWFTLCSSKVKSLTRPHPSWPGLCSPLIDRHPSPPSLVRCATQPLGPHTDSHFCGRPGLQRFVSSLAPYPQGHWEFAANNRIGNPIDSITNFGAIFDSTEGWNRNDSPTALGVLALYKGPCNTPSTTFHPLPPEPKAASTPYRCSRRWREPTHGEGI
jgi:hypothetical protein